MFERESRDWGKSMSVLHGFFDESGKYHQHDVVGFSGFLATSKQWRDFEQRWEQRLRHHGGIDSFHFSEHCGRTELVDDLILVMKRYGDLGVSVAVDVKQYNTLPQALKEKLGGNNAHHLAFKFAVLYLLKHVGLGKVLTFTCDEDEETTKESFRWYKDLKRTNLTAKTRLVSFCIADDEAFPQLQAADLFAAISRNEAESKLYGTPNKYAAYFERLKTPQEKCYLKFRMRLLDAEDMTELAINWNEALERFSTSGTIVAGEPK